MGWFLHDRNSNLNELKLKENQTLHADIRKMLYCDQSIEFNSLELN